MTGHAVGWCEKERTSLGTQGQGGRLSTVDEREGVGVVVRVMMMLMVLLTDEREIEKLETE